MSAVTLNRVSKVVLVASSFLTAYALLAIVTSHVAHHMREHDHHHGYHHGQGENEVANVDPRKEEPAHSHGHHHHGRHGSPSLSDSESHTAGGPHRGPHHHHKPCPLRFLTYIALFTGLTGIAAGFKPRSCRVICYMAGLFIFEIAAVLIVLGGEVRAVRWCQQAAMQTPVHIEVAQATVNNVNVLIAEETIGKPVLNEALARECSHRVVHVATMATLIIGVVVGALIGCASRLLRESREFERSMSATAVTQQQQQLPEGVVMACVASDEKVALCADVEGTRV